MAAGLIDADEHVFGILHDSFTTVTHSSTPSSKLPKPLDGSQDWPLSRQSTLSYLKAIYCRWDQPTMRQYDNNCKDRRATDFGFAYL